MRQNLQSESILMPICQQNSIASKNEKLTLQIYIYTVHTHIMVNSDQYWPILINFGQSVLRHLRGIFWGGNSSKEISTFSQLDKAKGGNLVLTHHIIHGTNHEQNSSFSHNLPFMENLERRKIQQPLDLCNLHNFRMEIGNLSENRIFSMLSGDQ